MHQQGSTTGADKLEFSPFHSNELLEPGALYRYMNWCTRVLWEPALIIHKGGCVYRAFSPLPRVLSVRAGSHNTLVHQFI